MSKISQLLPFSKRHRQVSFDALMRPHLDMLYRMAFRFCQHQQDAEDLVQDLMTKLYQRNKDNDELLDKQNLKAWLVTSLYHLFVDGTRKRNRSPLQLVDDEASFFESTPCHGLGPAQELLRKQHLQEMQCAFIQLSDEHRAVLTLHDIEGYKLTELQEMLGLPVGTLKSRIHRARARMRDLLQASVPDTGGIPENSLKKRVTPLHNASQHPALNEQKDPGKGNLLRIHSVNRV